jgi:glucose-6-phosphate 1-dehydrogenase
MTVACGWETQTVSRARTSASLLRFVDGDYGDPATFARLREELGRANRPLHYLAIPPELVVRSHSGDELMAPYERLLGDAMRGDPELFARQDAIEAAWRAVDPMLSDVIDTEDYDPGSWGPPRRRAARRRHRRMACTVSPRRRAGGARTRTRSRGPTYGRVQTEPRRELSPN